MRRRRRPASCGTCAPPCTPLVTLADDYTFQGETAPVHSGRVRRCRRCLGHSAAKRPRSGGCASLGRAAALQRLQSMGHREGGGAQHDGLQDQQGGGVTCRHRLVGRAADAPRAAVRLHCGREAAAGAGAGWGCGSGPGCGGWRCRPDPRRRDADLHPSARRTRTCGDAAGGNPGLPPPLQARSESAAPPPRAAHLAAVPAAARASGRWSD